MDEKSRRTIYQLNTLFKNPDDAGLTEIEVTDARHPLFGRRFPLISMSASPHGPGHVLVEYRDSMALCIPLAATTLAPSQPLVLTKLSGEAVAELLMVAGECEALCPLIQPPSGGDCPQTSNTLSSTISRRSFRRP
jgi:hypothetical protein